MYQKHEKNDAKSRWINENGQREYDNQILKQQQNEMNIQNQKQQYGYIGQQMSKSKSMAQIKITKGQSDSQKNIRIKQQAEHDKMISNSQKQGNKNVIQIQSLSNLLNPQLNRITESSTVTQTKSRQQKNYQPIRSSLDQEKHDFYPTPSSSLITQENQQFIQQYYPSSFVGSDDDRMGVGNGSTPSRQNNQQQIIIYPSSNSNKDQFKQYNIKQNVDQLSENEKYSPNTQRPIIKNIQHQNNFVNKQFQKNYQHQEIWNSGTAQIDNFQNNLIYQQNIFNQFENNEQRQDTARLGANELDELKKRQMIEYRYDQSHKDYQNQGKSVKQSQSQREQLTGNSKHQILQKQQASSQLKFQKIYSQANNKLNLNKNNGQSKSQLNQNNEHNLQSPQGIQSEFQNNGNQNYIVRKQQIISENIQPIITTNSQYQQINQVQISQKNYLFDINQDNFQDKKIKNIKQQISQKEQKKTFVIEQRMPIQKIQDNSDIMSPPLQFSTNGTNFQSKIQSSIKETKFRIDAQEQQNLIFRDHQINNIKKSQIINLNDQNINQNNKDQNIQQIKFQSLQNNQKSQVSVQPSYINTLNQYQRNSQIPNSNGHNTAVANNKQQQQKLYKIPEKHSSSQKKLHVQHVSVSKNNQQQQQKSTQIQRNIAVSLQPGNGPIIKQYISKISQKQQLQTGNNAIKRVKKIDSSAAFQKQRKNTQASGKQDEPDSNSEQFSNQLEQQQKNYENVINTDKQYINKQKPEIFSSQQSYRSMPQRISPKHKNNKEQNKIKFINLKEEILSLQDQNTFSEKYQDFEDINNKQMNTYMPQTSKFDANSPSQINQRDIVNNVFQSQDIKSKNILKFQNYQQNNQLFLQQKDDNKKKRFISKYESQEQFIFNNNLNAVNKNNLQDNWRPSDNDNDFVKMRKIYNIQQSQSTAIIGMNSNQNQVQIINENEQQLFQAQQQQSKTNITYRDQQKTNKFDKDYLQVHKRQNSYQQQNQPLKHQSQNYVILNQQDNVNNHQRDISRFKNKQIQLNDENNNIMGQLKSKQIEKGQNINIIYSNASSNDDSFSIQYIAQSRDDNSQVKNNNNQNLNKIYKGKYLKLNIDDISEQDFQNQKFEQIQMTIGSQSSAKYQQTKNESGSAKSCNTGRDDNQIVTFVNKSGSLYNEKELYKNKKSLQTIPSVIQIIGQNNEINHQREQNKVKINQMEEIKQQKKVNGNLINQWSQSHDILPCKIQDSIIGLKRIKQQVKETEYENIQSYAIKNKNILKYENQEQMKTLSVDSSNKQFDTEISRISEKQSSKNDNQFQIYNNPKIFKYQDLKCQQQKKNSQLQFQQKALSTDLRNQQNKKQKDSKYFRENNNIQETDQQFDIQNKIQMYADLSDSDSSSFFKNKKYLEQQNKYKSGNDQFKNNIQMGENIKRRNTQKEEEIIERVKKQISISSDQSNGRKIKNKLMNQKDKQKLDIKIKQKKQELKIITDNMNKHQKHISDLSDFNGIQSSKRSLSNQKVDSKKNQGRLLERASQRRGMACDGIYSIKNQQSHALLTISGEGLLSGQDMKSDNLTSSINNKKNHQDSRISFVPSMTPIFNDFDETSDNKISQDSQKVLKNIYLPRSQNVIQNQQQSNLQIKRKEYKNRQRDRCSDGQVPNSAELQIKIIKPDEIIKDKSNMISSDIFETMEREMKQIMNLFAKERKSRKRDISRLQAQLDDKQNQLDQERRLHSQEKNQIIKKWRQDTKQHEKFQEFMHQKVKNTENELQQLKEKYEPQSLMKSIGSNQQQQNVIQQQQNIQQKINIKSGNSKSPQKSRLREIKAVNLVTQIKIRGSSESQKKRKQNINDLNNELNSLKNENKIQSKIIENLKMNESKKSKSDTKSINSINKIANQQKPSEVEHLKINDLNYENESQNKIITPSIQRKNQQKNKAINSEIVTPKLLLNLEYLKKPMQKVENEQDYQTVKNYQMTQTNQQIVSRVNEEFLNAQQSQKIFGDIDSIRNIQLDSQKINFRKDKIFRNPFSGKMSQDQQINLDQEKKNNNISEIERENYENKINQLMKQIQKLSGELQGVKEHYNINNNQQNNSISFLQSQIQSKQEIMADNINLFQNLQNTSSIKKAEQSEIQNELQQNNEVKNNQIINKDQLQQDNKQADDQNNMQKNDKKQERPIINKLKLDQIINQANNFSQNLEELEAKIKQIDQIQLQNALMNSYLSQSLLHQQFSQTDQNSGILSRVTDNNQSQIQYTNYNGGSMLQGVQGGIDTQSLETILELRDLDLIANINSVNRAAISQNDLLQGTETANSQLEIRDLRQYNNSSTLSNFILPQTTYRTNRTNLSFRSGNGYGLIIGTNVKNEGGGTLRGGQIQSNAAFSTTNGILAAIPHQYQNLTLNGINEERNLNQFINQNNRQINNIQIQQQTAHSARGVIYQQHDLRDNNVSNLQVNHQNSINSSYNNNANLLQNQLNINIHKPNLMQFNQATSNFNNGHDNSNAIVDNEAISIIFDELQQSKKQVNEIMEWIQKIKEQNDDKKEDPNIENDEKEQQNQNQLQSNIQK